MSRDVKNDERLNKNSDSQFNSVMTTSVNNTPKVLYSESPSKLTRSSSIDGSLNDDLLSVQGNTNRLLPSSTMSMDSYSIRSSDSPAMNGRLGSRPFAFDHGNHSGSMEYSPLGNNSIYEIVMNTRRKNWLGYPSVQDIPPVVLTKDIVNIEMQKTVTNYVQSIRKECAIFESSNNLKSMNRIEQIKQLEHPDNATDICADEPNLLLKSKENLKELEEVPDFYFNENFRLDNPRTFQKVLKDVDLKTGDLSAGSNSERDNAYSELRDRLSDYLDAFEGLLVGEISNSSHKFFNALGDVDLIQQKAESAVNELDGLVENAKVLDKEKIQKRIDILQKTLKRKNVQKLEQGLLQVKQVLLRTEECRQFYEKEEYDACLDMIKSIDHLIRGDNSEDKMVQEWVADWPFRLVDLKSVPALTETREFLTNMKIEIGGKYSLQLCSVLLEDVRNYCKSVDSRDTLNRLQNNTRERRFLDIDEEFRHRVGNLIHQLTRCEELASSLGLYQDKCIAEIKSIIKVCLPQGNGSKLSSLIREQTPMEFQEMLLNIFIPASEILRRFYRHQKLLLDLSLNEIISYKDSNENRHRMITQLDIRNGINETIKILQLRMGRIIAVRRELTCNLRYDHFLKLYTICVLFIQECEAISGEFLTKYLSDVLASQIKNFIMNQSSKNIRTIQKKVESETWTPFVVESSMQRDVNDIVSAVEIDPIEWLRVSDLLRPQEQDGGNKNGNEKGENEGLMGHKKSVVVEDNTYVASDSLLTATGLIKDIFILSINLPSAYLANFEKMCYDILRYFNIFAVAALNDPARSSLQSNKNYSIMSESLDCLAHFIHIVQKFYRRLSNYSRDYSALDHSYYNHLLHQYRMSSEKIYMANAPPPPAPI